MKGEAAGSSETFVQTTQPKFPEHSNIRIHNLDYLQTLLNVSVSVFTINTPSYTGELLYLTGICKYYLSSHRRNYFLS